jgi:hypothetical protein
MQLLFIAIAVAVLLILLTNTSRWRKLSRSARESQERFSDEIDDDR